MTYAIKGSNEIAKMATGLAATVMCFIILTQRERSSKISSNLKEVFYFVQSHNLKIIPSSSSFPTLQLSVSLSLINTRLSLLRFYDSIFHCWNPILDKSVKIAFFHFFLGLPIDLLPCSLQREYGFYQFVIFWRWRLLQILMFHLFEV